ncbi:MAG: dihydrolipoyl dehydrogenase [Parvularculales bacterium]
MTETSESSVFDLIVIGSGPGGYVCAVRAAQLGMTVACIDKRGVPGGTCLNVGCIPSKALLHASEFYEEAAHMDAMGVAVDGVRLDLIRMMAFKDEGITGNTKGVEFLFNKNKVDDIRGNARIVAPGRVEVLFTDGTRRELTAGRIVIATGSDVAPLPGIEIDEKRIVSSTGALSLEKVPEHLLVVGGGYIGLELGSVWRRLGAQVTVVEFLDRITPGMDGEISRQFQRLLKRQGMKFELGTKVNAIEKRDGDLAIHVEPATGGETRVLEADVALISIGRIAYTGGLGLEDVGVRLDDRGRVETDAHFKTSVDGIYAIGDVIAGPMLAHKAEDEGVAVAEHLAGQWSHVNYDVIPGVVYTAPEVAAVGQTEEQLKNAGVIYKAGKFPFTANGRAKVNRTTDGFVKILADAETDRVLGVHIMGVDAGNMIAEAAIAMEFGACSEDIARTCHAHPTLTEAVKEAALDVEKRAIHM